jgi:hypothetical protein
MGARMKVHQPAEWLNCCLWMISLCEATGLFFQIRKRAMTMSAYSRFHPHDWIKDHLHLKPETIEIIVGVFILWIALMLFSYVVTFLFYWAFIGLGVIEEGLYARLFC